MKVTDGKRYYFAVGNEDQGLLSKEHTFEYKKSASEIKFLSYGDMGVKNSVGSVALMNKRALAKEYDLYVGLFFFFFSNTIRILTTMQMQTASCNPVVPPSPQSHQLASCMV